MQARFRRVFAGALLAVGVLSGALLPSGCGAVRAPSGVEASSPDDEAIARAGQAYVDLIVATSPESATTLGLHQRDADLDDRSAEGFARVIALEEAMLKDLQTRFTNPRASRQAKTDLSILLRTLAVDIRLKRETRPLETLPELYAGPLNALFFMMARDYAPAPERARAALARVEKLPQVVSAARTNLKNPPKVWTRVGIEAADGAAPFLEELQGFLLGALPGEKPRITQAVDQAKKAYGGYKEWLEREVLPRSSGQFASGKPLFEFLLRENYALSEDADALFALGTRVMNETEAKMTEVARRIDPKASGWHEVVKKVKGNHPSAAELLPSYRREVAQARAFLEQKEVVTTPPPG